MKYFLFYLCFVDFWFTSCYHYASAKSGSQDSVNLYLIYVDDSQITLGFNISWDSTYLSQPYDYEIEFSNGDDSIEFQHLITTEISNTQFSYDQHNQIGVSYNVIDLSPSNFYNFRVTLIYRKVRGKTSNVLKVQTLSSASIYWEPVISRPSSPSSTPNPILPSSRRGHTLSLISGMVYMFGGRTDGFSCALSYKDLLLFGSPESGRIVNPCTTDSLEVQELWTFNIYSYEWTLINSTNPWLTPPRREQHSAIVLNNNLYIFGGKRRDFDLDQYGNPILTRHNDIVYGDFYLLKIVQSSVLSLFWPSSPLTSDPIYNYSIGIPQDKVLYCSINGSLSSRNLSSIFGDEVSSSNGLCVTDLSVKVTLNHSCINQLRISIFGPGPVTSSNSKQIDSSSYEVILYNQRLSNSSSCLSGVVTFLFDDSNIQTNDNYFNIPPNNRFTPDGKLSEFIGSSPLSEWTLSVQDMIDDDLVGELYSWELYLTFQPCSDYVTWENLTDSSISRPPPRYNAMSLGYKNYIFIYGGYDTYGRKLQDLYRFDTLLYEWVEMNPINFDVALNTASSVGSNFFLTAWGLIRFGGYFRQPYLTLNSNYDNSIFVMDPNTMKWKVVNDDPWPNPIDSIGVSKPSSRYLSAGVFISSNSLNWRKSFSYRILYDEPIQSIHANYNGALIDSLLIFGGHNGASGSQIDGSTGGMLSDMWMLRFSNWSTSSMRQAQNEYTKEFCLWRYLNSDNTTSIRSCLYSSQYQPCNFRDLLLLFYCEQYNITIT